MFCIRRIHDDILPVDQEAIRQVQELLAAAFPGIAPSEAEQIRERLRNPFRQRFYSRLLVAEQAAGSLLGFAFVLWEPELRFCYLDHIASARGLTEHGVGGALYQRVQEEARALGARGLFFECLPDDPALCAEPELLVENAARLRFYEGFGARPIAGTAYETPVLPTWSSTVWARARRCGATPPARSCAPCWRVSTRTSAPPPMWSAWCRPSTTIRCGCGSRDTPKPARRRDPRRRESASGWWSPTATRSTGYRTRTLGLNARHFLDGFLTGARRR